MTTTIFRSILPTNRDADSDGDSTTESDTEGATDV